MSSSACSSCFSTAPMSLANCHANGLFSSDYTSTEHKDTDTWIRGLSKLICYTYDFDEMNRSSNRMYESKLDINVRPTLQRQLRQSAFSFADMAAARLIGILYKDMRRREGRATRFLKRPGSKFNGGRIASIQNGNTEGVTKREELEGRAQELELESVLGP